MIRYVTVKDLLDSVDKVLTEDEVKCRGLRTAHAEVKKQGSDRVESWVAPFWWVEKEGVVVMPEVIVEAMSHFLPPKTVVVLGPVKSEHVTIEALYAEGDDDTVVGAKISDKLFDEHSSDCDRYWCILAEHKPSGKYHRTVIYDILDGEYKPIHQDEINTLFFADYPNSVRNQYTGIHIAKPIYASILNATIIHE